MVWGSKRRISVILFAATITISGASLAQDLSYIVTSGPDGQFNTSFQRDGETFTLRGSDTLDLNDVGGGILHIETLVEDTILQPTGELKVVFEPTVFPATGEPYNDPIDPRFTGDLNFILADCFLNRGDVHDVHFERVELDSVVEVTSEADLSEEQGTLWIGDPADVFNAMVLQGRLNVTIAITTRTTPQFVDRLTIELFAFEPPPGSTIELGPDNEVATSIEHGTETYILHGNDEVEFMGELGGGGILHVESVIFDKPRDPTIELGVVFQQTSIPPTGVPFDQSIDPRFAGILDAFLSENSLTRVDVSGVEFHRTVGDSTARLIHVNLGATEDPGTVWIGSIDNDPFNVDVITGQLNLFLLIIRSTTSHFVDTLTIPLYEGAEPNPTTNLDLCPPPNGDGRIDAC
ncbi:MAG: hypothetical protein KC940_23780, partial [Candidatus Omnitrophica bacterium]|nr:hypothetical protein [Candidatus Omnitrophota bacterium]